jgi:exodeoxyribonuclease III
MLIATWNVNSIKQRMDNLTSWLSERQPDIVCLQETKCVDDAFPREPLESLGYNVAVHGQKTFNGVAILSKLPFDEVTARLPGEDGDDHARFMEAVVSTERGALRFATIYLPNGNPPNTDKYTYKISWMDRLIRYARERMELEEPLVLAGDFNVIPSERDARHPRRKRRARPIHVLGLPGRCLAEERRHSHRPPAAVAAGGRPPGLSRHRQACTGLGKAVGPRSGLGHPGRLIGSA